MKRLFTFALLVFAALAINAQTNIYSYNFDSYTVGQKIAQVAGAPWTTWSALPGGAEDGTISATHSHSASNAVYIQNDNDLVIHLSDRTTGRYRLEWYMYVETGKLGYFNILSDFAGASSKWAFQVWMTGDSVIVDANGAAAAWTPFTTNTWMKMTYIVDMEDDWATFYVDDNEVISYQYSKGAQGTDNTLKLDGVNFYGWNETLNAGYYIDDFTFDSNMPEPGVPTNLTAVMNAGDVDLSWTAPSPAPDGYTLVRNGVQIYSTASAVNYTDSDPWPLTYNYVVRAHENSLGYSHASNTETITVPGGVDRNLVLFEEGTSIYCGYCPQAATGLRDLIEVNNKDAVAIAYHPTSVYGSFEDAYGNASSAARLAFYSVPGFPDVISDGVYEMSGVIGSGTQYQYYLQMYDLRIDNPGFQSLDVEVVQTAVNQYQATIDLKETFKAFTSGEVIYAALTESNIPVSWGGQTEVDYVCRGMYPTASGTPVSLAGDSTQQVVVNFSTAGYVKNNCEFVVWVQHTATKEVTQTLKVDMSSIVGLSEINGETISVYPNPAKDYAMILSNGSGEVKVFDITGNVVHASTITENRQVISLEGLATGIYIINVNNGNTSYCHKLIVE